MSVKEIRELDEEVSADNEGENWEEKDIKSPSRDDSGEPREGEEKEAFSIGDTKLARGEFVESWGAKNLEDTISEENLNENFESKDFEEEEEDEDGFSYEAGEKGEAGDLYGESVSSGDMYGGRDASAGDLYGVTKREDSVSMYNTGGGSASESSLYNVAGDKKAKDMIGTVYNIEGPKKKKKAVRRGPKSGLETGIRKKRRSKGVSLH